MKRVIDFLMPKEEKFFDMLSQQATNALECRIKFNELITNYEKIEPAKKEELVREIKDLEDKGDHLTHGVIEGLNTTFITPIDKEDIHKLTILLDDVVDGMDEIATILSLYKIEKMNQHMQELAEIAIKSVTETANAVTALRQMGGIKDTLMKIQEYENQGDAKFSESIAYLLNNGSDPIEVIKHKDVYQHFEDLIDTCEDISHILDNIVVKHA